MVKLYKPEWLAQALPYFCAVAGIVIIALPDHSTSSATGVIVMVVSGVIGILLILLGVVLWAKRRRRLRSTSRPPRQ